MKKVILIVMLAVIFSNSADADDMTAKDYFERGGAYFGKREYDKAIDDYNKAIALRPNDANAYYNRGDAYSAKGEHDKAIEDYTKAIELYSDVILKSITYVSRGWASYLKTLPTSRGGPLEGTPSSRQEDIDKAIEDYTKAIELYPKNSPAYSGRAKLYAKRRQYDEAIKDSTKVIELSKNFDWSQDIRTMGTPDGYAYFDRSEFYYEKGDYSKAVEDYNKGLAIVPGGMYLPFIDDAIKRSKGAGNTHQPQSKPQFRE